MNIDELIEKSKSMPNISDGGSKAFSFGDTILVRYSILNKYGKAREGEEEIQIAANNKNSKGVNTPKHLIVKRVVEGDMNYCYVLQEKAKGVSYTYYTRSKDIEEHLKRQKEISDAPLSQYIKLAKDYCELFYMGLEPKDKNLFYDKEVGFTIIDLLEADEKGINKESLSDYLYLLRLMESIVYPTKLSDFTVKDKEALEKSRIYCLQMKTKIYLAIKEIIPERHRRFLLRAFSKETLDYFYQMGIVKEDLKLTPEEIKVFDDYLEKIIIDSYEKIKSGEYQLWQIEMNEIRNDLIGNGLIESFMYHPENPIKREEFEYNGDYQYAVQKCLTNYCLDKFYDLVMNDKSDNVYIINAQAEIESKKATK